MLASVNIRLKWRRSVRHIKNVFTLLEKKQTYTCSHFWTVFVIEKSRNLSIKTWFYFYSTELGRTSLWIPAPTGQLAISRKTGLCPHPPGFKHRHLTIYIRLLFGAIFGPMFRLTCLTAQLSYEGRAAIEGGK
jgi:hypothetical protein